MEVHKLKKNATPTQIDTYYSNICVVQSERLRGCWYLFDNTRLGLIMGDKVLAYDFDEADIVATTIGNYYGEKLKKELIEVVELFKMMRRGGACKWML